MIHRREIEVKSCAKIKHYPDGKQIIYAATKPIFGGAGWEESDKWDTKPKKKRKSAAAENVLRSKRRAAAAVRDLALCNDFRYFVTLTLDGSKIERYDLSQVVRKLNNWCDNRVRRDGLKYILVPEQHKDGAFHFHGFFNDALCVEDSGTLRIVGGKKPKKPRSKKEREQLLINGAQVVYNLPDWNFGFSTAIALYGEREAAIGYAVKYITKAQEKMGGRWYFSGGGLSKPMFTFESDIDFYDIAEDGRSYVIELPQAGYAMAILECNGEND